MEMDYHYKLKIPITYFNPRGKLKGVSINKGSLTLYYMIMI